MISPVTTPLRSVTALITTVVPWAMNATSSSATPLLAITFITPRSKSGGVVSALAVLTSCAPVSGSVTK